ncbi:MAG: hypothetical protein A3D96_01990 [Chlamydiae bacterium RIFCSPHIGHO2_12_FULL_44_59]|nr:MAG: hypothetical protein A2796_04680 [Chlamydiae bacterium RIFCSPHIGHO2_01_FULL_44_39]OGN60680.1 MAG: hypothetical protein A3D96_01990 [Chlamydiae bacterium RIFCSPHIGHO2_12_FULL_44_59]OGN66940.1 MAG: hypothetical protein A2978_02220 [Chlamydiae bacterium RIFCSPLOWO2_01_FULL_44_52]OGN67492.1 MAG: hypothetical protein A3I67_03435 [Chlamydiae bacterium RIFCSPLOWO2_02_FULL_45_22]OGN71193.1 MAG: hypothetical protein A3F79_02460 [Chlamydiae bacterium RIFCSPLOWO2_12_FULL_45_20]
MLLSSLRSSDSEKAYDPLQLETDGECVSFKVKIPNKGYYKIKIYRYDENSRLIKVTDQTQFMPSVIDVVQKIATQIFASFQDPESHSILYHNSPARWSLVDSDEKKELDITDVARFSNSGFNAIRDGIAAIHTQFFNSSGACWSANQSSSTICPRKVAKETRPPKQNAKSAILPISQQQVNEIQKALDKIPCRHPNFYNIGYSELIAYEASEEEDQALDDALTALDALLLDSHSADGDAQGMLQWLRKLSEEASTVYEKSLPNERRKNDDLKAQCKKRMAHYVVSTMTQGSGWETLVETLSK